MAGPNGAGKTTASKFLLPEVFHTNEFTQKSDIYAFGILMYLIASGEPPFRDRLFDRDLACEIMNGLRPTISASTPAGYKKLAEKCCDTDRNKRPNVWQLHRQIDDLFREAGRKSTSDDNPWNAIYYNKDLKSLSRMEKETKYSSRLLPTGDLPRPRNRNDSAGMKTVNYTRTFDIVRNEMLIDLFSICR